MSFFFIFLKVIITRHDKYNLNHSSLYDPVAHLVGQVHSEPGRILDARVRIPPAAGVLLFRTKKS